MLKCKTFVCFLFCCHFCFFLCFVFSFVCFICFLYFCFCFCYCFFLAECSTGTYGVNSESHCDTCINRICDRFDGNWTYGRVQDFKGDRCNLSGTQMLTLEWNKLTLRSVSVVSLWRYNKLHELTLHKMYTVWQCFVMLIGSDWHCPAKYICNVLYV